MSTAAMVRLLLFAGGVGQQRELEQNLDDVQLLSITQPEPVLDGVADTYHVKDSISLSDNDSQCVR